MIGFTVSLNPVWQRLAVINLFGSLATITGLTKGLDIENKTSTALRNWLDMIDGKFLEGKLMTTHKAMEIVELAEIIPFGGSISAARLSLARFVDLLTTLGNSFALRCLSAFCFVLFVFSSLSIFPKVTTFFGSTIAAGNTFFPIRTLIPAPLYGFTLFGFFIFSVIFSILFGFRTFSHLGFVTLGFVHKGGTFFTSTIAHITFVGSLYIEIFETFYFLAPIASFEAPFEEFAPFYSLFFCYHHRTPNKNPVGSNHRCCLGNAVNQQDYYKRIRYSFDVQNGSFSTLPRQRYYTIKGAIL